MKFTPECAACIIKQVPQLAAINKIDSEKELQTLREVLSFVSNADYSKSTPELIGQAWDILEKNFGKRDLYRNVKEKLNKTIYSLTKDFQKEIDCEKDNEKRFNKALRFDIAGNLIDFAASDSFDLNEFKSKIANVQKEIFGVDDSARLYEELKKARIVLCLADNCGEVALDKMFIKEIKNQFPKINVFYAVRGMAVINDVTIDDASDVNMSEVATVISNGDKSAGTVIENDSEEFKKLFFEADVVISKGQGNFEALYYPPRKNIFFLYMAKCPVTAKMANAPLKSIICKGF